MQAGEQGFGKDIIFHILQAIIDSFPNLQTIAIAGKNEKIKHHFDNLVSKSNAYENVKVLEYTNKVAELMSVSDLVITKPGGLTTTESLASRFTYNYY
ncbi:MAG: glycosyltransferase [Clostridia bacterium]|nr:glycosyltransferase [Clostridia bacterium]